MICPKCGTEIKEGEKFCRECGNQIIVSQNNSSDLNNEIENNNLNLKMQDSKEQIKKKQNNGINKIIIILIVLLLIFIIGILLIVNFTKSKEKSNEENVTNETVKDENIEKEETEKNEKKIDLVKSDDINYGLSLDGDYTEASIKLNNEYYTIKNISSNYTIYDNNNKEIITLKSPKYIRYLFRINNYFGIMFGESKENSKDYIYVFDENYKSIKYELYYKNNNIELDCYDEKSLNIKEDGIYFSLYNADSEYSVVNFKIAYNNKFNNNLEIVDNDYSKKTGKYKTEISSIKNKIPNGFDKILYYTFVANYVTKNDPSCNELCKENDALFINQDKIYFTSMKDKINFTNLYLQMNSEANKDLDNDDNEPMLSIINKQKYNKYMNLLFNMTATDNELKDYLDKNGNVSFTMANGMGNTTYRFMFSNNPILENDNYVLAIDLVDNLAFSNSSYINEKKYDTGYILTTLYIKYKKNSDGKYYLVSMSFKK